MDSTTQTDNGCWVVVAAKALAEAKSRLAPVLKDSQRRRLAYRLLQTTFELLLQSQEAGAIAGFVVVSSDEEILQLAVEYQGAVLREETQHLPVELRLNAALAQAVRWCVTEKNAVAVLLLPSDLPLLTKEEIQDLVDCLKAYPSQALAAIAPDQIEKGTNALLLKPPTLLNFTYSFGEQSFKKHLMALEQSDKVQVIVKRLPGLVFDLDRPEDLEELPPTVQKALFDD